MNIELNKISLIRAISRLAWGPHDFAR